MTISLNRSFLDSLNELITFLNNIFLLCISYRIRNRVLRVLKHGITYINKKRNIHIYKFIKKEMYAIYVRIHQRSM